MSSPNSTAPESTSAQRIYLPGFEGVVGETLPTGIWGSLFFCIAIYSQYCVHNGNTPLWPNRRLKFPLLWLFISRMTGYSITLFNLTAGMILGPNNTGSWIHCCFAGLWLMTMEYLVPHGVMDYIWGFNRGNEEEKNGCDGDTETASTCKTLDEKLGTARLDFESDHGNIQSPKPSQTESTRIPFPKSRKALASFTAGLILLDSALQVSLVEVCTTSLRVGEMWWLLFVIVVVFAFLFAGLRSAVEVGSRAGSLGAWDVFWRALFILLFYHTAFSWSTAESVLAVATDAKFQGFPVFEIPIASMGEELVYDYAPAVKGYAFFAGSILAFLLPLFSF